MYRRPSCCIPNCSKESNRFVFDKPYCNDHFEPAAKKAFIQEYHKWDGISENAQNMMNLFSIYVEYKYNRTVWPVYLSRARIRDRTRNIRKIKDGLTFCIVRHLNAWSDFKPTENVEQLYRYSVKDRKFELLCQDPDDKVNSCAWDIADALITKKTNPAIELKDSEKYGRINLINLKKIPPDVPYKTKRLKIKIKLLIKLYSNLEEINYGNRLAFKYREN
jgi:hypothetical protein